MTGDSTKSILYTPFNEPPFPIARSATDRATCTLLSDYQVTYNLCLQYITIIMHYKVHVCTSMKSGGILHATFYVKQVALLFSLQYMDAKIGPVVICLHS